MVEDLGESINATARTPAARHLFDVNKDCPKLTGKYAEVFHSVTAKNLYTIKLTSGCRNYSVVPVYQGDKE